MSAMLLCITIQEFYLINKETWKMHYKTVGRLLHQIQILLMSIQSKEYHVVQQLGILFLIQRKNKKQMCRKFYLNNKETMKWHYQYLYQNSFKGKHMSSIGSDQLNSQGMVHSQMIQRIVISASVLIFLIGSDIGIINGLYFFNLFLKTELDSAGNKFLSLEVINSGSLDNGIQQFIDFYYEQIAKILTDFENFQTSHQYETSFILKNTL
ncbi:unnamed protein product [Paramecium primaurelia]|uniref:Anoctamin transmembrane domain-containing protein n=1 Tax=Paramecium primaurelia TaxID=5886 RepID=A0A8S1NUV5_PARPR|nr:unnamed protein product [Paramecium primaurelia]